MIDSHSIVVFWKVRLCCMYMCYLCVCTCVAYASHTGYDDLCVGLALIREMGEN